MVNCFPTSFLSFVPFLLSCFPSLLCFFLGSFFASFFFFLAFLIYCFLLSCCLTFLLVFLLVFLRSFLRPFLSSFLRSLLLAFLLNFLFSLAHAFLLSTLITTAAEMPTLEDPHRGTEPAQVGVRARYAHVEAPGAVWALGQSLRSAVETGEARSETDAEECVGW